MNPLLASYLANINELTTTTKNGEKAGDSYIHPKLKNLGSVSLVLIREAVAPVVFRNAEQEITDIEWLDDLYVRAVPNKFKYIERNRGLQILRALGVGGRLPQNKTVLYKGQNPSDAFDLNTLVFGDSANYDNRVLPVRAAVNYSDALSLLPKDKCVDETFHNRAMEDGTLFDAESKKNSDNLFTRHFIKPGTLMVQVLSTRGQVLPEIGLKHLLLSVGMAGSYGGQTSVTGINIRTHVVGLYGGKFEQAITSPYELLRALQGRDGNDVMAAKASLHELLQAAHDLAIQGAEVAAWQAELIAAFNQSGSALEQEYKQAQPKVAGLFDQWFQ
ncbi:type I-D CRISPR-associated protein Cas7/Csc2 [Thiothrix fructosivorans]|uniref:Type I-D CRISPR-associated protein Cas7/Csc2 n=1 Tax=Thiothrix fructosivorans TaxID=111770 RepID=A0A8B0SST4_9GAMM|nr:type I-D CRISPR-associated protein Cas7/Csc2 [Thiothrix fructosivorans]MBO0611511.1 type I-D CRISPR-associated protein Cas7/Csc2 [Thiothrix fructosivorans]QTX13068.1 type I-D CRISPR-associated protein Cas7/Csc2 [Thiothrix fructosivorans]